MSGTCVVCLGGGHSEDGLSLNSRSHERISRAVSLFHAHGARTLICSGAYAIARKSPPPETEAALMAGIAEKGGVPASAIMREERSLDTIGNIAVVGFRLLPLVAPQTVCIVSSDYHLRRVRYLVEHMWAERFAVSYVAARARLGLVARLGTISAERRLVRRTRMLLASIEPGDEKRFLAARPLLPPGARPFTF
mgnify:FL=1